ncbi:hypothetical protein [Pseudomonas phage PMBT14]|uniref:Uncharacterized protein n=1 Tax=Pseudomonas phage PMBT14 TaxID=2059855 RepID=A0A2I6PIB7_9CAUD|nr:hypothetical protein HWB42_gp66 [Pseudomonas phage PMBT14]AUM59784.1 hypothetical protein [Pseudomonas phage PMBT14]UOL48401.1 hypothetical protein [Pseudomonas phage Almagne]
MTNEQLIAQAYAAAYARRAFSDYASYLLKADRLRRSLSA